MLSIKDLEAFMHINEALWDKSPTRHEAAGENVKGQAVSLPGLYMRHMKHRYSVYRTLLGMK